MGNLFFTRAVKNVNSYPKTHPGPSVAYGIIIDMVPGTLEYFHAPKLTSTV